MFSRFTSRKFLIAAAAMITAIIGAVNPDVEEKAEQLSTNFVNGIQWLIPLVYVLMEGFIDKANLKSLER